jgi:class 3 adenylate cyclase
MSAWLLSKIIERHNIAYLLVDARMSITYASIRIDGWLNVDPDKLEGSSALEYFPELAANEEMLQNLDKHHGQGFLLRRVERSTADGQSRYYDLYVEATPPPGEGYLLLLSDVTEPALLMQKFATQRNELRLLSANLEKANQKITYLLKQFVPEHEAEALIREQELPAKEQETQAEATLLVADLSNLTRLVRTLPLEQVLEMLDNSLEDIDDSVQEHKGSIIQLDGNLLIVSFNLPQALPNYALHAAQAALDAQRKLARRFSWWQQGDRLHLGFGFGLSTGWVVGTYLGVGQRCQYSLIGDSSITAYQLAAHASAGQVRIDQATRDRLGEHARVELLETPPGQLQPCYALKEIR